MKRIHRLGSRLFLTALAICAWPAMWIAGPSLESMLWPTLTRPAPLMVTGPDGWTTMNLLVTKQRDCTYLSTAWLVGQPGSYRKVRTERANTPRTNRPQGRQWLDEVRIDTSAAKDGDNLIGVIYHRCHAAWDTASNFGPWAVQ